MTYGIAGRSIRGRQLTRKSHEYSRNGPLFQAESKYDQTLTVLPGRRPMTTQWSGNPLTFHVSGRRDIAGRFAGGRLTPKGGERLLREVDHRLGQ